MFSSKNYTGVEQSVSQVSHHLTACMHSPHLGFTTGSGAQMGCVKQNSAFEYVRIALFWISFLCNQTTVSIVTDRIKQTV